MIRVGLGWSTLRPSIDFETYSEAGYLWGGEENKWDCLPNAPQSKKGLEVVGIAVYATHPSTEVLVFGYEINGGARQWSPGMPNPEALFAYLERGGKLAGWNLGFEWWIWNFVCVPKYGWPVLSQSSLVCTMARARAHALPGSLENAGKFLGLDVVKDDDGKRLLKKFSVPQNPTKKRPTRRIHPSDDFIDWQRLCAYNLGDLKAEAEVAKHAPDLSPAEERYWRDDQQINARGVKVDVPLIDACCAIVTQALDRYTPEMERLTGGIKPTEVQKILGWLHGKGIHLDELDEDAVEAALKLDLPPDARRVLEIRALVASASVKKVYLMRLQVSPFGRLHDLYTFHGARTGRPTGNGPQPTNLPKAGPHVYRCACKRHYGQHLTSCPWCGAVRPPGLRLDEWSPEAMMDAIEVIMTSSLDCVEWFFGDALHTVAGCLRGIFIAEDGHTLVSSDYSSIEAVVIAALANEQWRLDVFRTHGQIYLVSASKIFGVPFEDMVKHKKETGQHHPLRQYGKIAELALGFMGWINAWREFDGPGTDEEIKRNILAWREASPAIVYFAGGQSRNFELCEPFGCEGMAVKALENPGYEFPVMRLDGTPSGVSYLFVDGTLYCRVPSGGLITYHRARLEPNDGKYEWRGKQVKYEGWNTNPKQGPIGWHTMSLYAGKFVENVVQRVARDIQMPAIARVQDSGYPVVLHTYDEIVGEVPDRPEFTVEDFEAKMNEMPPWAAGWPIKASGGWRAKRYRKAA